MADMLTLYHGSNVVVKNPKVLTNGFYKDFGYGFYCTNLEKQAQRWALTKRNKHIVNIYSYEPDSGIEHHYDIVEGPMADDTIWDYIESYVDGSITKEAFWVLVKFKYPTHQIVYCTERALATLQFVRSYAL